MPRRPQSFHAGVSEWIPGPRTPVIAPPGRHALPRSLIDSKYAPVRSPPGNSSSAGLPGGNKHAARDSIGGFELLEQKLGLRRVLTLCVVRKHVRAEVNITAENLIRTFAGIDDLVAGIAHRAAEQIL